jgi:uncharacterized membrane protein
VRRLLILNGEPVDWWVEDSEIVVDYQKSSVTHDLNIIYYTDLVTYSEAGYVFSFTHTTQNPTQLNLNVKLPAHATLSRGMATTPEPQISSDGEHIILSWSRELNIGGSYSVAGMYNPASESFGILPFIIVAIIAAVAFILYRKKTDGKLLLVLSEDERKIYKKVKEIPGITQKEVEKFTGFSKAKVSKLIRNLESSKLLKKQPHRKTNKLWAN